MLLSACQKRCCHYEAWFSPPHFSPPWGYFSSTAGLSTLSNHWPSQEWGKFNNCWNATRPCLRHHPAFPQVVGFTWAYFIIMYHTNKTSNHQQLFPILCGREERSAEGKFDTKKDMGMPEQTDQYPRKTKEQSVHVCPQGDKRIKQTTQVVLFCQKLTPDESSVLFWQGGQPAGWLTTISHDIFINKLQQHGLAVASLRYGQKELRTCFQHRGSWWVTVRWGERLAAPSHSMFLSTTKWWYTEGITTNCKSLEGQG